MRDHKRLAYILSLLLLLGLMRVYLYTSHRQSVYKITQLVERQQECLWALEEQRVALLSGLLERERLDRAIAERRMELYVPGEEPEQSALLACEDH